MFRVLQTFSQTHKKIGGQAARLEKNIFQPNSQALNFHRIFRHCIPILFIFIIRNRINPARILNRRQIFPLHQRLQIGLHLLHGVIRKLLVTLQQLIDILLVKLEVHSLIFLIKIPHDLSIDRRIRHGQIRCLANRLQMLHMPNSFPIRVTCCRDTQRFAERVPCFTFLSIIHIYYTRITGI